MSKYKVHECKSQPSGVLVSFCRSTFHDDFTWQIKFSREAAEEDLESNHYLEQVGDELWSFVAEISNCPYCGKELAESLKNNGEFVLFDSTGCSLNVL